MHKITIFFALIAVMLLVSTTNVECSAPALPSHESNNAQAAAEPSGLRRVVRSHADASTAKPDGSTEKAEVSTEKA